MIYTKFMFTPGVEWPDGEFTPKANVEEADEAVEREGEGTTAYSLMGFDPDGERWEVLMVAYRPTTLVRRVNMMFGTDAEWNGSSAAAFDRAEGISAVEYSTHSFRLVRAWLGLMAGCCAAYADNEADWPRFEKLARRLGVTIRKEA